MLVLASAFTYSATNVLSHMISAMITTKAYLVKKAVSGIQRSICLSSEKNHREELCLTLNIGIDLHTNTRF